ncbi:MAG: polysaccharide deacetylase [Acidobacteriaceae bacterium]|nr:polysaccharide deacetylase [Acidobacteriaceae bacterium]
MHFREQNLTGEATSLKARSILYHDVTEPGDYDSSGFSGPAAGHYKLAWPDFERHLEAIRGILKSAPATILDLLAETSPRAGFLLTFDDGGISTLRIAERLQEYGWRAHFFISTDYVGKAGFLKSQHIVELRRNGHVIGSHSCSHPRRMSSCSWDQLLIEWKQSADILAQIVGEPISVASVPGGNYSRKVAQAAAEAGMKVLFTSEPTVRPQIVDGCQVLGRYGIVRGMSAASAANLAAGRWAPCVQQLVAWKMKMALKSIGGNYYERFRDLCFGESGSA